MSDATYECRLDALDGAERARYGTLRAAMKAAAQETKELADGYAVRIRSDAAVFRDVAEWITLERRCCPFLTLGLDWSESDAVWLSLRGGAGVKSFLARALTARS